MKENENGERECFCRLLKIDMGSIVTPTSSGQLDPMIHPVALGPQIMTETSKILIKRSGLIEGSAKYKALWEVQSQEVLVKTLLFPLTGGMK